MSIYVELTGQEIAAIRALTKVEDDAAAVVTAAREFLRLSRLRELKAVCGKVDCEENWQELEALELNEIDFQR